MAYVYDEGLVSTIQNDTFAKRLGLRGRVIQKTFTTKNAPSTVTRVV